MYKYKGAKGEIWLNEEKSFVLGLAPFSNKVVKVVCPECKKEREAGFCNITKAGHSYHNSCVRAVKNQSELLGRRFGRLVVIGFDKTKSKTTCVCRCDCGKTIIVSAIRLKQKNTRSCGCFKREDASNRGKLKRGKNNPMFGRIKEKNPSYRPEISEEERLTTKRQRLSYENYEWRKKVFERDNHTCRHCGKRGGRLAAHHMNSFDKFPEQRFDLDNGVTLCEKCHKRLHSLLGGTKVGCTRKECESVLKKMKEEFKQ